MKSINIIATILIAALFFTACEKEETPETFDTISGVLTPGENVTAEDLNGINIHLWKLWDDKAPFEITSSIAEMDYLESDTITEDGCFSFNNLENGKYLLSSSLGYMFSIDTFLVVTVDGINKNTLRHAIERVSPDNFILLDPARGSSYQYICNLPSKDTKFKLSFYCKCGAYRYETEGNPTHESNKWTYYSEGEKIWTEHTYQDCPAGGGQWHNFNVTIYSGNDTLMTNPMISTLSNTTQILEKNGKSFKVEMKNYNNEKHLDISNN